MPPEGGAAGAGGASGVASGKGGQAGKAGSDGGNGGAPGGGSHGGRANEAGAPTTAGAGGSVTPPRGCALDADGACESPPRLLADIPGCSRLQLRRAGGVLYALSTGTAQLWRFDLEGLATPALVADALLDAASKTNPTAFTIDAANAYVAAGYTITRVDLTTGAKALARTSGQLISDVTVADGKLFYVRDNALVTVDAAGTNAVGQALASAEDGGVPLSVGYTQGRLVWASDGTFQIEAKQLPDGVPFKVAPSQGGLLLGPGALQVDFQYAYWVNFGVQRAAMNVVGFSEAFATPRGDITAFTTDSSPAGLATKAYFASATGDIEKSLPAAATAFWVARDLDPVSSLAVDAFYVYAATTRCQVLALKD